MSKAGKALEFIVKVAYIENKYQTEARECISLIKQALEDKDKRIKELESQLNKIRKVFDKFVQYTSVDQDYINIMNNILNADK